MDRDTVAQAARQLQERGDPISARAVRRVIGRGSHRDIGAHLRALETTPPALPAAVRDAGPVVPPAAAALVPPPPTW
jgi:plasmid replication DNA-binding protein KfrA